MIVHIVMFKFKNNSEEGIEKAKSMLLDLEGKIEETSRIAQGSKECSFSFSASDDES